MKLKMKFQKKKSKTKQIAIKGIITKFSIKIKWNEMLRDVIKKFN